MTRTRAGRRAIAVLGLLRRAVVHWPAAVVVVVVTTLAVATAVLVPRAVDARFAEGARRVLAATRPLDRTVTVERIAAIRPGPPTHPLSHVRRIEEEFVADLDPVLSAGLGEPDITLDVLRHRVRTGSQDEVDNLGRFLTPRWQSGVDVDDALVAGRAPAPADPVLVVVDPVVGVRAPTVAELPVPPDPDDDTPPPPPVLRLPVLELAVTRETADRLGVGLGTRLVARPDTQDPLSRVDSSARIDPTRAGAMLFEVVGILELRPPEEAPFRGDRALHRATAVSTGLTTNLFAHGLISPAAYPPLVRDQPATPVRTRWVHEVVATDLSAAGVAELHDAVRRVVAIHPRTARAGLEPGVRTRLDTVLGEILAQRRLALDLLVVAAAGLVGTVLAVVAVLGHLRARQREDDVALQRGRGASRAQLGGAEVLEGAIITGTGGVLGTVLAVRAVAGPVTVGTVVPGVVVAATVLAALVAPGLALLRTPLRRVAAGRRTTTRPARVVAEVALVAVAAAALVAARGRGIAPTAGVDPLLLAAPLLVGLAAAVATLRVAPLLVSVAAESAAWRRGLVVPLALRRVARGSGTLAPLVVTLLPVAAVATFTTSVVASLDAGRLAASWRAVGAEHAVTLPPTGTLPPAAVAAVDGVAASAALTVGDRLVRTPGFAQGSATVLVADPADVDAVTAGTPVATALTAPLGVPVADDAPVPVVVSSRWLRDVALRPGDRFEAFFGNEWLPMVVAGSSARPPAPAAAPWFVAERGVLERRLGTPFVATDVLVSGAPAVPPDTVRAALVAATDDPEAVVRSRHAVAADLADAPLARATTDGFVATAVAALVGGLVVVVVVTALATGERRRELALLRTVGVGRRSALALAVLDLVPGVVLAVLAGVGAGAAVTHALAPTLDLRAFTGGTTTVAVLLPWPRVLVAAAGLVVVTALLSTTVARTPVRRTSAVLRADAA